MDNNSYFIVSQTGVLIHLEGKRSWRPIVLICYFYYNVTLCKNINLGINSNFNKHNNILKRKLYNQYCHMIYNSSSENLTEKYKNTNL